VTKLHIGSQKHTTVLQPVLQLWQSQLRPGEFLPSAVTESNYLD